MFAALVLFVATGVRGLDFGRHWDEGLLIEDVRGAVRSETLLPGRYQYPSVSFWLTLAPLVPRVAADPPSTRKELAALQVELDGELADPSYRPRARLGFLLASALAVLAAALGARALGGRRGEAAAAAAIAAGSWQFAYHARWMAPDAVMAALGGLATAAALAACRPRRPEGSLRGAWAAAVLAGLACGAKYTGGIFLFPALIAAQAAAGRPGAWRRAGRLAAAVGLFAAAFLATTPGALLQPFQFFRDVRFEIRHYATGHWGYTVEPGLGHLAKIARYVGLDLGSEVPPLAAGLALAALAGAALVLWRTALLRDGRARAAALLAVPLLLTPYLASQRVLFVRNLLPLHFFLAVLAPRGAVLAAEALAGRAPRAARAARLLPWALAVIALVAGTATLVPAAESIARRSPERTLADLAHWLETHPGRRVAITARLAARLAQAGHPVPPGSILPPETGRTPWKGGELDGVVMLPEDAGSVFHLPSNRPGSIERWFGPREVDLEWYWTWPEPHPVLVSPEVARDLGVLR